MPIRCIAAAGALMTALFVWAAAARADVLDQVPADALVVVKVKNLDALSTKVAKFSKDAGFDKRRPELVDGLSFLSAQVKLGKGLKRDGDAAVAFLDPKRFGGPGPRAVLLLVPTTDLKTFLTNFTSAADDGGGVHKVVTQSGGTAYVEERGRHAAVSFNRNVLGQKATGLRLTGLSGKENDAKDLLVFANIKALREKSLPQLRQMRADLLGATQNAAGGAEPPKGRIDELLQDNPKFAPLAKAAVGQLFNVAEQFLNDAHSATLGIAVTDAGVTATVQADFDPTSHIGKIALQTTGTDASLVAGLPDRRYFFYAGGTNDPKTSVQLASDFLDPIIKELAVMEDTKRLATSLEGLKSAYGATRGWVVGYVAPSAKVELGKESLIQQVTVVRGDAKAIRQSQRQAMEGMNDLLALMPQRDGTAVTFEYKPGGKQVGGMDFDVFRTNVKLPEGGNDVQAEMARQKMLLVYGPNGMGGVLGSIDDNTVLAVQGGSDELEADAYAAAKANADTLGAQAGVRATSAELPKVRSLVVFVDVGTIVNTGLRYAKRMGPIDVKAPNDLPPIGMSAGVEGTSLRMDVHVPARLVQGLAETYEKFEAQRKNPNGDL